MLNYEYLAKEAAERISEDMQEKMMHENYLIHSATITVDVEDGVMTVDTVRKDPIGIEFKAQVVTKI